MHVLKKRGLSQVIATILLVLLVLVAIGIIAPLVINIVRDNLKGKGSCFTAKDELKLSREDYAYNCYDQASDTVNITVYRGDIEMDSFYISITGIKTTKIENENDFPTKNGGEKTYNISVTGLPTLLPRVTIYPEIEGRKCDVTDDIALEWC